MLLRRTINLSVDEDELTTNLKLKIFDPTGKILQETIAPIKFTKSNRATRLRMRINAIPITVAGDYEYQVEIQKPAGGEYEKAFEIPFLVTLANDK